MKTREEKQAIVDGLAEEILVSMDGYVYETSSYGPEVEKEMLEDNKKLVQKLIAAARELGRDFSDVIR